MRIPASRQDTGASKEAAEVAAEWARRALYELDVSDLLDVEAKALASISVHHLRPVSHAVG
jgi:hypothetical protein